MVPGLLEQARRAELLPARRLLLVAEDVRIADLHRHVLPPRVLLDVGGVGEALQHALAGRDHAVGLQHHHRVVAHDGDHLLAHLAGVDRHRRVHHRHVAEQRRLRVHHLLRHAGHGQIGRPLRMGVEHRVDLRPGAIDLGMDREFQRRLDVAAVDRLAVEIDRDDVLDGEQARIEAPELM